LSDFFLPGRHCLRNRPHHPGGPRRAHGRGESLAGLPGLQRARGPRRFSSKRGTTLDFSYSGLKSQALLEIEKLERKSGRPLDLGALDTAGVPAPVLDLLADFRAAAVAQILDRLDRLHRSRPIPLLAVSGGVAANRLLRRELTSWAERNAVPLRLTPLAWAADNAAMIAHAALLRHRRGQQDDLFAAEAESRIAVESTPKRSELPVARAATGKTLKALTNAEIQRLLDEKEISGGRPD
jgi:tRNA N6-adenosine threonylcarbamoyltransferase